MHTSGTSTGTPNKSGVLRLNIMALPLRRVVLVAYRQPLTDRAVNKGVVSHGAYRFHRAWYPLRYLAICGNMQASGRQHEKKKSENLKAFVTPHVGASSRRKRRTNLCAARRRDLLGIRVGAGRYAAKKRRHEWPADRYRMDISVVVAGRKKRRGGGNMERGGRKARRNVDRIVGQYETYQWPLMYQ